MNKNKIALVGMPGSGKSTVGPALATKMGYPFYDLDQWLTDRCSLSIAEQFSLLGEQAFRERERDALQHHLAHAAPFVLATGGGTPIWFDQMKELLKCTLVVWLDVEVGELHRRMMQSPDIRPLIDSQNSTTSTDPTHETLLRIQEMHKTRYPIYSKAHIPVKATGTPAEVAQQILQKLNQ
jgi:shikimate kinase